MSGTISVAGAPSTTPAPATAVPAQLELGGVGARPDPANVDSPNFAAVGVWPTVGSAIPTVRFVALGDPTSQGSKKAWVNPRTGRAQMREQTGTKLVDWRRQVASAAHEQAEQLRAPLDGALELGVTFRFRMPASRPAWVRRLRIVPRAVAPDLSKLVRALEDGMAAAGLIRDDALIARLVADKVEVIDGWLGAEVCVRPLLVGSGAMPS